jgi:diacylglycerol kinase (ATP)
MDEKNKSNRSVPDRVRGLSHILAAFCYSMGGLRRLVLEAAFVLEVSSLVVLLGLFMFIGAGWYHLLGLVVLFLMLFAIEALNTAIECIVDEISPNYSDFAKHVKDLGSVAVFFNLTAIATFVAFVFYRFMTSL